MDPTQLQQLYKQGLISDQQYQAAMAKMGQQQGGQFQTGVQAPNYNGPGALGAQIGKDAGSIVTAFGNKIGNAMQPQNFASGAGSVGGSNGGTWVNPDDITAGSGATF